MITRCPPRTFLAAAFALSLSLSAVHGADNEDAVEAVLQARDFYETSGTRKFSDAARTRLEELRLTTLEDRIQADLSLGHHADLIGELQAVVADARVLGLQVVPGETRLLNILEAEPGSRVIDLGDPLDRVARAHRDAHSTRAPAAVRSQV